MTSKKSKRTINKKGFALIIALGVLFVLGILIVAFFNSSRQAQSSVYRFFTSEVARQLASAGQEEAFKYLHEKTGDFYNDDSYTENNDIAKQIIEKSSSIDVSSRGIENRNSVSGIEIPLPATKALIEAQSLADKVEIKATAKIIDFVDTDYAKNKFQDKLGMGTIEIVVTVQPKESFKKQNQGSLTCTIVRHHDYKVVSIKSSKETRQNKYCDNNLLDYALFVTNGLNELLTSKLTNINPEKLKLEVDAGSSLGRVNLGALDSGSSKSIVILNTSKETEDFVSGPKTNTEIFGMTASDAEIKNMIPGLEEKLKEFYNRDGKTYKSFSGAKISFYQRRLPAANDSIDTNDTELVNARKATIKNISTVINSSLPSGAGGMSNPEELYPGIKITPIDKLYSDILDCDTRKLFFNAGHFKLDLSQCEVTYTTEETRQNDDGTSYPEKVDHPEKLTDTHSQFVEEVKNTPVYCLQPGVTSEQQLKDPYKNLKFDNINKFIENKSKTKEALTYFNFDYAYDKADKDPIQNKAKFYNLSSTSSQSPTPSTPPFANYNLYNKRELELKELKELGIYDEVKKELHLRGIIQLRSGESLELNSVTVDGYGAIIADTITINGAIKKAKPHHICILYAKSEMKVSTDQEIEAALIAFDPQRIPNETPITVNGTLNVKGSLVVGRINTKNWRENVTHKITYDDALRPNKDVYQINLSRRVTFERVIENE